MGEGSEGVEVVNGDKGVSSLGVKNEESEGGVGSEGSFVGGVGVVETGSEVDGSRKGLCPSSTGGSSGSSEAIVGCLKGLLSIKSSGFCHVSKSSFWRLLSPRRRADNRVRTE